MIFQFEQARVEVGLNPNAEVSIRLHNGMVLQAPVQTMDGEVFKIKDAFNAQLTDFAESIINKRPSRVSGEDGLPSIQLVEQCFDSRKSIQEHQPSF
ncbi:MAG: hypothetical protein H7282_13360 [Cytophagaceae bacterium]|nr:hypothetical protein [Cytophagaceae bacterium]